MIVIHDYETPSAKWWRMTIQGMRNSWESWEKGDSAVYVNTVYDKISTYEGTVIELPRTNDVFVLGEKDEELFTRLIKLGPDHGKYLRKLPVLIDISAPNSWWIGADTYKIGTTRDSTSKMHILGKEPFRADMFSWGDMDASAQGHILVVLNYLRDEWISAGKKKGPQQKEWRAMVQAIPDSWIYRSSFALNYQVLRNMYHARKNHRLSEWRDFCNWIETLPYAKLITLE